MRIPFNLLVLVMLVALAACASRDFGNLAESAPFASGWLAMPLPNGARGVSSVEQIPGNDTYDRSVSGVTDGPGSAVQLAGSAGEPAWVIYGYDLPGIATFNSGSLEVSSVTGGYWLGFSDYGTSSAWEWHGPYNASEAFEFSRAISSYFNTAHAFYWAVVADAGSQVEVQFTSLDVTVPPFELPPTSLTEVDPAGLNPSLALHPGNAEGAQEGAPLIAFMRSDAGDNNLYIAYYSSAQWHVYPILPDRSFANPQLAWDANGGRLIAHDTVASKLVDLTLNDLLQVTSEQEVFSPPSAYFTKSCRMARDPATGNLGVIHIYTGISSDAVYYSEWTEALGWQTDAELYNGESTLDLSTAFNPLTGEPAVAFTHGTATTSGQITVDYTLEYDTRSSGAWSDNPLVYPDSPVLADLAFLPDGKPQLAFSANRTWVFNQFPLPYFEADIIFDGVVATGDDAGGWNFDVFFESTISWTFNLPSTVVLTLNEAVFPRWAKPGELGYSKLSGDVDVNILSQEITGGNLQNETHYATNQDGSFSDFAYFTGDPGLSFSWASLNTHHACAYNKAEQIDITALLNGGGQVGGALEYWQSLP